jgi:hypothetical protein
MSNSFSSCPICLDTDITTFRSASAVIAANVTQGCGIRVSKLVLTVGPGGASSAGTVTITAPSDSAQLYPPMPVAASIAANSILATDEPPDTAGDLTWRDFAVTGLTATGTKLYLWYSV